MRESIYRPANYYQQMSGSKLSYLLVLYGEHERKEMMERLVENIYTFKGKVEDCENDYIIAVQKKLKEYEDLEERINNVYGDCDGLLLKVVETLEKHSCVDIANNTLKSRLLTDEDVDKWEEYKQLEEQGRLLKLPCKVGDTVYAITRDFISEYTICSIEKYNEGFVFIWRCEKGIYINVRGFTDYDIGKTVFITQAEAEQKLKEMESD